MATVTSVIEKEYTKDGETRKLWKLILEKDGTDIEAVIWSPVKKGDEIEDDRLSSDGKGGWIIKSNKAGGGKQWPQKDNEIIIAQVAFKAAIDLTIAGKLELKDVNVTMVTNLSKIIQGAAAALKGAAPAQTPAEPVKAAETDGYSVEDIASMDWSEADKKDYDAALARVAKAKKLTAASAKAFLVDKFDIESSADIVRGKRNAVIQAMAALK